MYRFIYSSDVNGSASSLSRIPRSFMIPSYRARTTRQSVPDRVPKRKKKPRGVARVSRRTCMNPHPSSNAMTPPGRPTLALIARAPASPPLKRVPFFLRPRARSLPLARASSASSSSFKRTELDQTRPNSTAAPPRRDALDARSSTRPRAATDRDSPLDAPLDARRSIPVNASRRRLASRDWPRVLNHACTRAPARLDRSRSRSMKVDRWTSIAIDESRSMDVDDRRRMGRSIDVHRSSWFRFTSRASIESVGRSVGRSVSIGRSIGRSRSVGRSVSIFHRSVDRGRASSCAAAIERARASASVAVTTDDDGDGEDDDDDDDDDEGGDDHGANAGGDETLEVSRRPEHHRGGERRGGDGGVRDARVSSDGDDGGGNGGVTSTYSRDGMLFACASAKRVDVYDATKEPYALRGSMTLSRPSALAFSAKKYLAIYQKQTSTGAAKDEKNLTLWSLEGIAEGAEPRKVYEVFQRQFLKAEWPYFQFSGSDATVVRCVSNEIQIIRPSEGFDHHVRLRVPSVAVAKISPGPTPRVTCFVPEVKGAPGSVRVYELANHTEEGVVENPQAVARKSFFRVNEVDLMWSPDGTAVLILGSSEVDATNKWYYGESCLHYLKADGSFEGAVPLNKEGPVHDAQWSPCGDEFGVVYGYMPAKATIYKAAKCEPKYELGLVLTTRCDGILSGASSPSRALETCRETSNFSKR